MKTHQNCWNSQSIRPFKTYDSLKLALQPVLVSAELFGRHFYSGSRQSIRVCICNDANDARSLPESELEWRIEAKEAPIADGTVRIGLVPYYENEWVTLTVEFPAFASKRRSDAQFRLLLRSGGILHAENTYDIVVASQSWVNPTQSIRAAVLDADGAQPVILRETGARFVDSFRDLEPAEIAIITKSERTLSDPAAVGALLRHVTHGGCAIAFNSGPEMARLFPDRVHGFLKGDGEIVTMRVPESPVFDGINPLDLSWWELGSGQLPCACRGSHQVSHTIDGVEVLAEVVNTHGYLKQPPDFNRVAGSPFFEIRIGAGRLIACELLLLDSAPLDPIASRLFSNLLAVLNRRPFPKNL